jgi:UrcA family protein
MKTRALVFTAALLGCLAGTAQATTTANTIVAQEVVSYADLDLTNGADAAALKQRIKSAARRVCSVRSSELIPMELRMPQMKCVDEATARAVADVDALSVVVANARQ